ncbi:NAD(P)H steroid dehydrogenase-like protein in alkane synthesis cluster [Olavius sp. associated proteobacterium Delta 1]|nr:NAD(P)H steroid dehydrogenase-like protein in alkane synthesis cluster [Olavius sp. associated proteobacterium Delta 1]
MTTSNSGGERLPEKVLVTGGGGFLGRAIVRRLIDRGDDVRSLARNFYPALEEMGVDQIQGDISNPETVAKACDNRGIVFHVAAKPPPWGKYDDYYQTNVIGTQNIINSCLSQNISRLVYTSTPSVVFNGKDIEGADESMPYPKKFCTDYSKTKAIAEQNIVRATNQQLKTIILRPHEIWGPGDNHILPRLVARANRLKQIGDGKNRIDTIYIDDAADAHILAADKLQELPELSGNIYFISQDEPVLAWDMVNALLKAAGCSPIKKSVPFKIAWLSGALLEFIYKTLRLSGEPYITRFMAQAVSQSHWFNISAAKKDLGYRPKLTTAEGLKRLEDWLRSSQAQGAKRDDSGREHGPAAGS